MLVVSLSGRETSSEHVRRVLVADVLACPAHGDTGTVHGPDPLPPLVVDAVGQPLDVGCRVRRIEDARGRTFRVDDVDSFADRAVEVRGLGWLHAVGLVVVPDPLGSW